MALPEITTREQWLVARKALLEREKEFTRARDQLNADRRRLPMVRVEKKYRFDGPDGAVTLADLFGEHEQLVVQHFMFDPEWDAGCPGCTAGVDEMGPGVLKHMASRGTAFAAVSRAPYEKLANYREARGWSIPWYSSFGSDFNYDFHVSFDSSVAPVMYNYRTADELTAVGAGWLAEKPNEQSGFSAFLRSGSEIFHTYSVFARGGEQVGSAYGFLDITALGRHEEWEEPKNRVAAPHGADPTFSD